MNKSLLLRIGLVVLVSGAFWAQSNIAKVGPNDIKSPDKTTSVFALPIDDFWDRITKKPFGIYITPANSPVQPEKFSGYHTAVDVEYTDVAVDANVPIYAIADGTVVISRTASGYGGLLVIDLRPTHNYYAVYGHVAIGSVSKIGTTVQKGDVIGKLGKGFSTETSGERKHLHFGVINKTNVDIAGYVSKQSELSGWIDPKQVLAGN